jgi:hypothetical protein
MVVARRRAAQGVQDSPDAAAVIAAPDIFNGQGRSCSVVFLDARAAAEDEFCDRRAVVTPDPARAVVVVEKRVVRFAANAALSKNCA